MLQCSVKLHIFFVCRSLLRPCDGREGREGVRKRRGRKGEGREGEGKGVTNARKDEEKDWRKACKGKKMEGIEEEKCKEESGKILMVEKKKKKRNGKYNVEKNYRLGK